MGSTSQGYASCLYMGGRGGVATRQAQSVAVATLGTLTFRFSAIGLVAVEDWNMLGRRVCLVLAAD